MLWSQMTIQWLEGIKQILELDGDIKVNAEAGSGENVLISWMRRIQMCSFRY